MTRQGLHHRKRFDVLVHPFLGRRLLVLHPLEWKRE